MTEAHVLAGELHRADGDVQTAFENYHSRLAKFVKGEQDGAKTFRMFFAPNTRFGVWVRNAIVRLSGLPGLTKMIAGRTVPPFVFPAYEHT